MNDSKYDASTGKLWVCLTHVSASLNKFNGWPESCGPLCMVNAQEMPLIKLELADGKLIVIRENV